MKKLIAFALAAVLTLGSVAVAFAANGEYENGNENGYYANEYYENGNGNENGNDYDFPVLPLRALRIGYITEFNEETKVATMECEEHGKVLLFLDGVPIVEAYDGFPAGTAELVGVRAKAFIPPFGALIYPPQFRPYVLVVNVEYLHEAPQYHVVEALDWEDDDTLLITVERGSLIIRLERETPLDPYMIRIMKHLETIGVGDEMLFWYSFAAMSYPAQTTATRALWLRPGEQEADDANENDNENENDNDNENENEEYEPVVEPVREPLVVAGTGRMVGGVEFFPVRATIAKVDVVPSWDAETSSAFMAYGGSEFTLINGSATFYVDKFPYYLPAAVFIEDGVMYAPYEFFVRFAQ